MEFNSFPVALPAIIALCAKIVIFAYARHSRTHNLQTRLFLWALFALAIQNLAEINIAYRVSSDQLPAISFSIFYATSIIALCLFFHLGVFFSTENRWPGVSRAAVAFMYLYAGILLLLLIFTNSILQGVTPVGYTVTRIPGELYPLFEIYAIGSSVGLLALFAYGALHQDTASSRAKNALLLAGMFPTLIIVIAVLGLLHFEVKWVHATSILPLAITLFVVVSAYAIYQHRIFDIQIFIPWSKSRRRKTAFHSGVRRLISEIAELPSANEILRRLSDTLRCPVVLMGPSRTLFAGDGAGQMADLPPGELEEIGQIVVADEIYDSKPHMYTAMKSRGIAAIVPFYPNSEGASGWLLLGDSFNEQVHSPLDFRLVEELFGKMSELFIDRFVMLRSQLNAANKQLSALTAQNKRLQDQLRTLESEKHAWRADQPVDPSSDGTRGADKAVQPLDSVLATPLTFLGRDREMVQELKHTFRAVKSFVGLGSVSFRRSDPDGQGLIVCRVDDANPKMARFLSSRPFPRPTILYGTGAETLAERLRPQLGGALIDVVMGDASPSLICARVRSLTYLHRHLHSLSHSEQPLLGTSACLTSFVQQLQVFAGFKEPVLLVYDDQELTLSAATYLHEYAHPKGKFVKTSIDDLDRKLLNPNDTVLLTDFPLLGEVEQEHVANLLQERSENNARLLLSCPYDHLDKLNERVRILTQGFSVQVPRLHERRDDIPLMVHYYTLGFNLEHCAFRSLNRAEVRSLKLHDPGWTLHGLRRATIEFLASKSDGVDQDEPEFSTSDSIEAINQERSLEELIGELEFRIIKQTLEKCEGNKSKAARILGLRPNTLHYKLERYGLNTPKRGRRPRIH